MAWSRAVGGPVFTPPPSFPVNDYYSPMSPPGQKKPYHPAIFNSNSQRNVRPGFENYQFPPHHAQLDENLFRPKLILQGRKWRIEHFNNNLDLILRPNEEREWLSMFRCKNAKVEITDKMKKVKIEMCENTEVILKGIKYTAEFNLCSKITLKCTGKVPIVKLEKCNDIGVFLSEEARGVHVISRFSKNLRNFFQHPDGFYVEFPAVPVEEVRELQPEETPILFSKSTFYTPW